VPHVSEWHGLIIWLAQQVIVGPQPRDEASLLVERGGRCVRDGDILVICRLPADHAINVAVLNAK
jgi:hypothetical protein